VRDELAEYVGDNHPGMAHDYVPPKKG